MHQKSVIVRGLSLALGMAAALSAVGSAHAEELPLYLTLSQGLTRDSNLLRDNSDRRRDTISTTTHRISDETMHSTAPKTTAFQVSTWWRGIGRRRVRRIAMPSSR